jgi:hypothetical protein
MAWRLLSVGKRLKYHKLSPRWHHSDFLPFSPNHSACDCGLDVAWHEARWVRRVEGPVGQCSGHDIPSALAAGRRAPPRVR